MSKSILVMKTPDACMHCPMCFQADEISIGEFEYRKLYSCRYAPSDVEDFYLKDILRKKPDWCPFKEIPKKKEVPENGFLTGEMYGYEEGWNKCLDEILEGSGNNT